MGNKCIFLVVSIYLGIALDQVVFVSHKRARLVKSGGHKYFFFHGS
jgi:hypothetical protein